MLEYRTPAGVLAEDRGQRNTDDVRHGQAREHHGHRAVRAVALDQRSGDDGTRAEEGAVRQAGNEAAEHHETVCRGGGREQVARGEPAHQHEEHGLTSEADRGGRQQRRADDHAQRVDRDQLPGLRNRDGQVGGHLRQEAHHHEFAGADGESADGEGEQGTASGAGEHCAGQLSDNEFEESRSATALSARENESMRRPAGRVPRR
jgi:hypothetical protein